MKLVSSDAYLLCVVISIDIFVGLITILKSLCFKVTKFVPKRNYYIIVSKKV